jgi:cytochrome c553
MKKILVLGIVAMTIAALSARAEDAKTIYNKSCAMCHGEDGKGQTMMGRRLGIKDFTDAKVQANLKDDAMTKAIKEGMKDADGKTLMKPFDSLSADDIKGLVAYIRTFKK